MSRVFLLLGVVLAALVRATSAGTVVPRVTVSPLFSDHMVLQQRRPVPVWGTAIPGTHVCVTIAGQVRSATAGPDSQWSLRLAPLPAGGPHELCVLAADTLVLHDVMVGEVWLASGQSNMEMPVDGWGKVNDAAAEVAAADHPDIRLCQVQRRTAFRPERTPLTSGWVRCSPRAVREFSAAAYFFGRELQRELHVPVGLVQASWGGTEIEAWTRAGALRRVPELARRLDAVTERASCPSPDERRERFRREMAAWLGAIPQNDLGSAADPPWSALAIDEQAWKPMTLPGDWEDRGLPDLDGVVWFRRHVQVPEAWSGRPLTLHLGRIDDADLTFWDGVPVGRDSVYDRPRVYAIPPERATAGPHTIAVRVFDWMGGGGLWGDPAMMKLERDGADSLALAGEWSYRVALDLADLPPRPSDPEDPNQPGVLANGMIAPLVPFAMRGVIWYQGEANAPRAKQYRSLFPLLIDDWRAWWGAGAFPFLFVQLAGFGEPPGVPGESNWAELREAQAMALARPLTGMAVAIDIGDAHDIHPRNKQDVGRRLALTALDVAYRRPGISSGPRYASMTIVGSSVRVRFGHTGGALRARSGGPPFGFAVAGDDRVYHWAQARIEGDQVVVGDASVPRPVAVRYAWAGNPECDLVGATGLPAAPFRTDRWPGITHERR